MNPLFKLLNFSIEIEVSLNHEYSLAKKFLAREFKDKNIRLKREKGGYIISSLFYDKSDIKEILKKLKEAVNIIGSVKKESLIGLSFQLPLGNGVEFITEIDFKKIMKFFPDLKNQNFYKFRKFIKVQDFNYIVNSENNNLFFTIENIEPSCFVIRKMKNFRNDFLFKIISIKTTPDTVYKFISYLEEIINKVYFSKSKQGLSNFIVGYEELNKDLKSYKSFKDKYKSIELLYDLKIGDHYLYSVWGHLLNGNIKEIFWYNDLKDKKFKLNRNSSSKRFEILSLDGGNFYFKELDLFNSNLKDTTIYNSTIINCKLERCYLNDCILLDSTANNSYIENSFWDENFKYDKNTKIITKDRNIKDIGIDRKLKNY